MRSSPLEQRIIAASAQPPQRHHGARTAASVGQLARAAEASGDIVQAELLYAEIFGAVQRTAGDGHDRTLAAERDLARVRAMLGPPGGDGAPGGGLMPRMTKRQPSGRAGATQPRVARRGAGGGRGEGGGGGGEAFAGSGVGGVPEQVSVVTPGPPLAPSEVLWWQWQQHTHTQGQELLRDGLPSEALDAAAARGAGGGAIAGVTACVGCCVRACVLVVVERAARAARRSLAREWSSQEEVVC
eukprot:COSAG01_NODE_1921_length_8901_cov_18.211770_2_plen_243_part_00